MGVLVDDLRSFGRPIVVPADHSWTVVAVEHTEGTTDGVVVMSPDLDLSIRTERSERLRQPISVRVHNLQSASACVRPTPHPERVRVDEASVSLTLDGAKRSVNGLATHDHVSFEIIGDEIVVGVSGSPAVVKDIRLVTISDLTSISPDHLA